MKVAMINRASTRALRRPGRAREDSRFTGETAPSFPCDIESTVRASPTLRRCRGGRVVCKKNRFAAKAAALTQLRERVCVCAKCPHLARTRMQTVFGVGNPDAELMFVGEAPGADEDARGEPFVGRAGQLLTRIIETMGLSRDEVYIANILKCRPDMPKGAPGNRPPTPKEMSTCIGYLIEQIEIIQPRVLVALGATAVEGLLGTRGAMRQLRGTWRSYHDTSLMITYHPSYLLRNQSPAEKRKVWEDMMAVLEKLERPITERQRNYFL